jgi:chromosome segregation ATPase
MNIDITAIIIALVAAGALDWARSLVQARSQRKRLALATASPDGRAHAQLEFADQSILVVAKARDELEADNDRLRATLVETRQDRANLVAEHAKEREAWRLEREALRAEVDDLSTRLRTVRLRLDQHYPND